MANAKKPVKPTKPATQPVTPAVTYRPPAAAKPSWPVSGLPPFVVVNVESASIHSEPEDENCNSIARTPQGSGWRVIGEAGDWWKVEAYLAKSDCTAETHG